MTLKETYQKRSIKHLELWEDPTLEGWRIKLYGITHESRQDANNQAEPELIEAAKAAAKEHLPQPAVNPHRYGLGFIGIHQGRSYDFVFICYWNYDTELKHISLMRASSSSTLLEPIGEQELSNDVWDLRVLSFERDAWVKHVLSGNSADADAYLAEQLNETV